CSWRWAGAARTPSWVVVLGPRPPPVTRSPSRTRTPRFTPSSRPIWPGTASGAAWGACTPIAPQNDTTADLSCDIPFIGVPARVEAGILHAITDHRRGDGVVEAVHDDLIGHVPDHPLARLPSFWCGHCAEA